MESALKETLKNLETFPHHKHTKNDVIDSDIPKLSDIFKEAMRVR